MSAAVERVLAELGRATGSRPRRSGDGWAARCPAHDDRHASLSVSEGADGRVLLRCFAGCSAEQVVSVLGLELRDLFADDPPPARNGRGERRDERPRLGLTEQDVALWHERLIADERALRRLAELRGWTLEAIRRLRVGLDGSRVTLPYYSAAGELVGLARYAPNPGARGDDPKMVCEPGSRRELWPPPEAVEVADGAPLWLTEGEPDCLRAWSLGLPAVAVPGVRGWRRAWAKRLSGRRVVVVMDCDRPGREAAQRVAADLLGHASEVRVLDLAPDRDDGYDLSDYARSATDAETREQARRLLLDLASRTPPLRPDDPPSGPGDAEAGDPRAEPPEDAGALLDDVEGYVRRYVVLGDAEGVAVALWVAHTHCFGAAECTPYLHVTSAEKASGKTRLLEVLELLAARPRRTSGMTAAALARTVSQSPPPSLLLDETDNLLRRDATYVAALLGVLNDGYRRGGKTVLCLPPDWQPTDLPCFAPKAVAGLRDLPDTLASRCIRVEMRRRAPDEPVARLRYRRASAEAGPLRSRLAAWGRAVEASLAGAEPDLPDELDDRSQDMWEPLVAIADLAGGEWPERARRAALTLSGAREPEDDSLGVRLLGDIRDIFESEGSDRITTADLVARLVALDEAPWGDLRGRPITARALAKMLRPYGVRPRNIRIDDGTISKGYLREQFDDPFSRYLPRLSATSATSAQPSRFRATDDPLQEPPVADTRGPANPHGYWDVADVADRGAGRGESAPDEPVATVAPRPAEPPLVSAAPGRPPVAADDARPQRHAGGDPPPPDEATAERDLAELLGAQAVAPAGPAPEPEPEPPAGNGRPAGRDRCPRCGGRLGPISGACACGWSPWADDWRPVWPGPRSRTLGDDAEARP